MPHTTFSYRSIEADGIEVFYREAGHSDAPVLLLLYGFANASHMFRYLMPVFSERFRMIAPDFTGFGSLDYASNVALYPQFQAYLREARLNLLAVRGRFDPFFVPAGAEAFRREIPGAYIQFADAGHFALEADVHAIALATLGVVSGFLG